MYEGYRVIDADGHFYEPRDIWDRYVEPEFYDRRPRVREIFGRSRMDFEVDGVFFHKSEDYIRHHQALREPGGQVRGRLPRLVELREPHQRHGQIRLGHSGLPAHRRPRGSADVPH